jgi:hypothetical protein
MAPGNDTDTIPRQRMMRHSNIPSTCTGDFSQERWLELTQPLQQHEPALVQLAVAHGLAIRASSRWPEVGLRCSSLLTVREIRVSLTPESMVGATPTWAVRALRYPRWPLLARRSAAVTEIALLTHDELVNGQRLLAELSKAIAAQQ